MQLFQAIHRPNSKQQKNIFSNIKTYAIENKADLIIVKEKKLKKHPKKKLIKCFKPVNKIKYKKMINYINYID